MKKRMNKKDWFETHIEVISLSGTKKEDKKTKKTLIKALKENLIIERNGKPN